MRYYEFRGNNIPAEAKRTTSLIALYRNNTVEVGPRARLALFRSFGDGSILGIQKARVLEMELIIDRVLELIPEINPSEPPRTTAMILRRGRGVAVYEAPRGTLIHYVTIDEEGRIGGYRIVVPTLFNIPIMEKACVGLPVEVADVIPRIYDPCIPCSTHLVRVDG